MQQLLLYYLRRFFFVSTVSPPASANFVRRSFCSAVSEVGVFTFTVINWSPRPEPLRFWMPLLLSLKTVPVCVPGGTLYFTLPSRVGTSISAPRAA